jgi:hypothetical protein
LSSGSGLLRVVDTRSVIADLISGRFHVDVDLSCGSRSGLFGGSISRLDRSSGLGGSRISSLYRLCGVKVLLFDRSGRRRCLASWD